MNDITRFITEYICDVENAIDVMTMQSDIRKYTELEHEAEIMKSRISRLEEIEKADEDYQGIKDTLRIQQYIAARAGVDEQTQEMEAGKARLVELLDENSRNDEGLILINSAI